MITRDSLKQKLDSCPDEQLQQIADFLEFLTFRQESTMIPVLEDSTNDGDSNDTSKAEVLADFRQAWHEAMTGQGIPVRQLWEELEQDSLND